MLVLRLGCILGSGSTAVEVDIHSELLETDGNLDRSPKSSDSQWLLKSSDGRSECGRQLMSCSLITTVKLINCLLW